MNTIEIGYAPKTVQLVDGSFLHFWYANNRGMSGKNCTIIRSTSPRADVSAKQENIISRAVTSHWLGRVNFSKRVQGCLGL